MTLTDSSGNGAGPESASIDREVGMKDADELIAKIRPSKN
jgi:hypothetical protein